MGCFMITETQLSFSDYLRNKTIYLEIGRVIRAASNAKVYHKGSVQYNKRRIVHNGLCKNMFPDLILVPKSTEDVSAIVKTARYYQVPISIRSGGHSYTCTNIKESGIHIDLRGLNKIKLTNRFPFKPPGPALLLGPGSTWDHVLQNIPQTKYTMIHGQCLTVGVGGYILGGGTNVVGTSQRYGNGASHVLEYTMVDAEGNIIKTSENNITILYTHNNKLQQVDGFSDLYKSLKFAGSSFGVVTEFLYRIFEEPELTPAIALIYIEDRSDLWKLQKAGLDGRYSLSLHVSYWFTPLNWFEKGQKSFGITAFRLLINLLPSLQFRKASPVILAVVDNFPKKMQQQTSKERAYIFLEKFGVKLAVKGKLSDMYQPSSGFSANLKDYEGIYQTRLQRKRNGPRPIISANFMNLTNINSIDQILMNHPLFGLQNYGSRSSSNFGCEYCFLSISIYSTDVLKRNLIKQNLDISNFANDVGNFQIDLTCLYEPNIKSKCPKIVRNAKESMTNLATRFGEKLTQYYNTPSCDSRENFMNRYWGERNKEMLLKAKQFWDPQNVFNHCHSVGSTIENCCPSDA